MWRTFEIVEVESDFSGGIDAQRVKTATQGTAIGYAPGKRVKGRKRHVLVDRQGSILQCKVTAANISDADGSKALLLGWATIESMPKIMRS